MLGAMGSSVDHRRLHDDEDADFAAYLRTLEPADWERPSLCEGWRVRDVVGHILYGNELKLWTLPWKLAKHGFSSDRSGKANSIARAQGRSPEELVADFERRDAWAGTCRVFPPRLVLLDRLTHHQDIRRALGHPRTVPEDRLRACLDATPGLGSVFRAKRRVKGLRLEATDLDWSTATDRWSAARARPCSWPCWAGARRSPTSRAPAWPPSRPGCGHR
jgi:uncharacterized protein (TIGR03083 family)